MSKRKQNQTRRQWLRHQANRYAHRAKASRPESGSRVIRIDDAFYLCHAQRGVHLVIEGPDHLLAMIEVDAPLYPRDFGEVPYPHWTEQP